MDDAVGRIDDKCASRTRMRDRRGSKLSGSRQTDVCTNWSHPWCGQRRQGTRKTTESRRRPKIQFTCTLYVGLNNEITIITMLLIGREGQARLVRVYFLSFQKHAMTRPY